MASSQGPPSFGSEWAGEHFADCAAQRGRCPIALYLDDVPPPPSTRASQLAPPGAPPQTGGGSGYGPPEPPSPLLQKIHTTLQSERGADYDAVAVSLTNATWKARWDALCVDGGRIDPDPSSPVQSGSSAAASDKAAQFETIKAAEHWRLAGHFRRNEVNLTRQAEALKCICITAQWLELDSPVEGIRLDSELVRLVFGRSIHR